jgi:hypothetical protein
VEINFEGSKACDTIQVTTVILLLPCAPAFLANEFRMTQAHSSET